MGLAPENRAPLADSANQGRHHARLHHGQKGPLTPEQCRQRVRDLVTMTSAGGSHAIPALVVLCGSSSEILWANPAALTALGIPAESRERRCLFPVEEEASSRLSEDWRIAVENLALGLSRSEALRMQLLETTPDPGPTSPSPPRTGTRIKPGLSTDRAELHIRLYLLRRPGAEAGPGGGLELLGVLQPCESPRVWGAQYCLEVRAVEEAEAKRLEGEGGRTGLSEVGRPGKEGRGRTVSPWPAVAPRHAAPPQWQPLPPCPPRARGLDTGLWRTSSLPSKKPVAFRRREDAGKVREALQDSAGLHCLPRGSHTVLPSTGSLPCRTGDQGHLTAPVTESRQWPPEASSSYASCLAGASRHMHIAHDWSAEGLSSHVPTRRECEEAKTKLRRVASLPASKPRWGSSTLYRASFLPGRGAPSNQAPAMAAAASTRAWAGRGQLQRHDSGPGRLVSGIFDKFEGTELATSEAGYRQKSCSLLRAESAPEGTLSMKLLEVDHARCEARTRHAQWRQATDSGAGPCTAEWKVPGWRRMMGGLRVGKGDPGQRKRREDGALTEQEQRATQKLHEALYKRAQDLLALDSREERGEPQLQGLRRNLVGWQSLPAGTQEQMAGCAAGAPACTFSGGCRGPRTGAPRQATVGDGYEEEVRTVPGEGEGKEMLLFGAAHGPSSQVGAGCTKAGTTQPGRGKHTRSSCTFDSSSCAPSLVDLALDFSEDPALKAFSARDQLHHRPLRTQMVPETHQKDCMARAALPSFDQRVRECSASTAAPRRSAPFPLAGCPVDKRDEDTWQESRMSEAQQWCSTNNSPRSRRQHASSQQDMAPMHVLPKESGSCRQGRNFRCSKSLPSQRHAGMTQGLARLRSCPASRPPGAPQTAFHERSPRQQGSPVQDLFLPPISEGEVVHHVIPGKCAGWKQDKLGAWSFLSWAWPKGAG